MQRRLGGGWHSLTPSVLGFPPYIARLCCAPDSCPPSVDPALSGGQASPIHPIPNHHSNYRPRSGRQPISFVAQNWLRKSSWQRSHSVRHINLNSSEPTTRYRKEKKGSAGRSRPKLRPFARRRRRKKRLHDRGRVQLRCRIGASELASPSPNSSRLQRKSAPSLCDMHTGSDCSRHAGKCVSELPAVPRTDGVAGLRHGCHLECVPSPSGSSTIDDNHSNCFLMLPRPPKPLDSRRRGHP
ncbi:hypothetical protein LY76DRAFT_51137 [Colletotrichum caudatum]|nr:hypothetical protein LY76DRAFT_51137 [Colletotrichum caudatum]